MTAALFLASQSTARRRVLENAGVMFETVRVAVDEEAVKDAMLAEAATPGQIADTLAEMKALRGSQGRPGGYVIGADQVLAQNGKLFSKPQDMAQARAQLVALSGQRHDLFTAVAVARNGTVIWRHLDRARLTMRPLPEKFIDGYLARLGERALQTVGGYEIEGLGAQLFEAVEGDIFAIQGLPLLPLLAMLRQHGLVTV